MIHPAVIAELQPFLVTSWHGHRGDDNIPPIVNEVWRRKSGRLRGSDPRQRMQSNVDIAILDSAGRLVHWFDAMPRGPSGRRDSIAHYTARELQKAVRGLGVERQPKGTVTLRLPDLKHSRGIRVFVTLNDHRMPAYRAPIVEAVPLQERDWKPLVYPDRPQRIAPADLKPWLSQVYPGGVMERTDPRTKRHFRIREIQGELTLTPTGADAGRRYALLSGNIRLTDEGRDNFSYTGRLDVVLTYELDSPRVKTLRGVFEGTYPRFDRIHNQTRNLALQAVFESRPE